MNYSEPVIKTPQQMSPAELEPIVKADWKALYEEHGNPPIPDERITPAIRESQHRYKTERARRDIETAVRKKDDSADIASKTMDAFQEREDMAARLRSVGQVQRMGFVFINLIGVEGSDGWTGSKETDKFKRYNELSDLILKKDESDADQFYIDSNDGLHWTAKSSDPESNISTKRIVRSNGVVTVYRIDKSKLDEYNKPTVVYERHIADPELAKKITYRALSRFMEALAHDALAAKQVFDEQAAVSRNLKLQ